MICRSNLAALSRCSCRAAQLTTRSLPVLPLHWLTLGVSLGTDFWPKTNRIFFQLGLNLARPAKYSGLGGTYPQGSRGSSSPIYIEILYCNSLRIVDHLDLPKRLIALGSGHKMKVNRLSLYLRHPRFDSSKKVLTFYYMSCRCTLGCYRHYDSCTHLFTSCRPSKLFSEPKSPHCSGRLGCSNCYVYAMDCMFVHYFHAQ